MPEEWAEVHEQLVGVVHARGENVEGEIHTDQATVAYVGNVATAFARDDVFQSLTLRLELEPVRPENQPKSENVKGYAIVEAGLNFNKGEVEDVVE